MDIIFGQGRRVGEQQPLRVTQTLKGWLYVAVTSFLLYYLLRRIVGRRDYDPARTREGIVNRKT